MSWNILELGSFLLIRNNLSKSGLVCLLDVTQQFVQDPVLPVEGKSMVASKLGG